MRWVLWCMLVLGCGGGHKETEAIPTPTQSEPAETERNPPDRSTLAKYKDFAESACACKSSECQESIRGELDKWEAARSTVDADQEREIATYNRHIGKCLALTRDKVASAPGRTSLGVPTCDEYISKYMHCVVNNVPEASRSVMVEAFTSTEDAWRRAASTEAGRKALSMACAQAMEAASKAMEQFGCRF